MNRQAQALADALAGNIRLWISPEAYTQAHVRNLLLKAGVPIRWERGPIRVDYGRLTVTDDLVSQMYEVLWEPGVRTHAVALARGLRISEESPYPDTWV